MLELKRNALFLALAATGFCMVSAVNAQEAAATAVTDPTTQDAADDSDQDAKDAAARKAKTEDSAAKMDVVEVRGFRQSVETAIAVKRDNSSIVEVISAEDIGKLPDVSIGEALARLPGVTTQRVDGRAQVISIRGLSQDFSTALLNGREQVTTGDNRGIEFDQYPAELLGGVVVYKTPDANLVGQGLAGTVDLRTIRPLEHGRQTRVVNARYEATNDSTFNPDAPDTGHRITGMFIDQFLDDTLGITLGVAVQSTPFQQERFNAWGFPTVSDGGPRVIGGAKPFVGSNDLNRTGLIGTIEYRPSDTYHTTLDLSYYDFNETQLIRGIEFPLFWSNAQLRPDFTAVDGLVTQGTFDNVRGVMRNDRNERNAQLFSFGWNNRFQFNDSWGAETDLSYSRSERSDDLVETYLGTGPGSNNGLADSLGFSVGSGGQFRFSPTIDYGNPALFGITDPQGWGGGAGLTQAGFINSPDTEDQLAHLKLSVDRAFSSGAISKLTVGADFSRRDKDRQIRQQFLTPENGTDNTNGFTPIPTQLLFANPVNLGFIGIPGHLSLRPLELIEQGFLIPIDTALSSFNIPQDWKVREDIALGFIKADIDTQWGDTLVSGNIGVQAIYTDQSSGGFRAAAPPPGSPGVENPNFVASRDGDKYWRLLPSLNLVFDFGDDMKARLGAGRTMARARMDQLNAGLSLNVNRTQLTSTDPNRSAFSSSGGNANLKPFMSTNLDLSLEKYFADGKGYIALAGYYKDLEDFVNPNSARLVDFSQFVDEFLSPEEQQMLGTPFGTASGPTNSGSGWIAGGELTASVPLDLLLPALDGFGVITNLTYTDSSVHLAPGESKIPFPGLSEYVVNTTLYFERSGFSARLGHRYRDDFLSEIFGLSATRVTRSAKSEAQLDAQVSYEFQQGTLHGLTLLAQANNLTDAAFTTFEQGDGRFVIDRQKFGVNFLFGASYKF
ncbi:MAG: TonB-dependent receptor [Lysobacterales bacterium]